MHSHNLRRRGCVCALTSNIRVILQLVRKFHNERKLNAVASNHAAYKCIGDTPGNLRVKNIKCD
jgi:hypothetical protein